MTVKILGGGCKNCEALAANTGDALRELGITAEIVKVTDYSEIAAYGVMSLPALVIDNKAVIAGRVAKTGEIVKILKKRSAET